MGHARIDGMYLGLGLGALLGSILVGVALVRVLGQMRAKSA